ncbi:glycerol-3-phosphatase [Thalassospira profundimaris]|uniref:Glycerol-3-phosphatase n=1 Tax=Thalassospira profundimaris TaxID=502049 RepID=A0A367XAZ0_9PROT|nr:HAD-IA family hydrolase [Thalassospira profundimaris]RCK49941.1 glycerol-3-phosphatase [Thalassospira profundimaris]
MTGQGFEAFLFDMDGTIVNSIEIAEKAWGDWARRHGLNEAEIIHAMHGVRAVETIARFAPPGIDIEQEEALLTEAEFQAGDRVKPIGGAAAFLSSLPRNRWAVVTSAPHRLAVQRINAAGLPMPDILITAEDVTAGKPAPDCFLMAAQKLGFDASDCLVWEDAPAGIAAGKAAGATVMIVTETHAQPANMPGHSIINYHSLSCQQGDNGRLILHEAHVSA